jgi:hypothetical protein
MLHSRIEASIPKPFSSYSYKYKVALNHLLKNRKECKSLHTGTNVGVPPREWMWSLSKFLERKRIWCPNLYSAIVNSWSALPLQAPWSRIGGFLAELSTRQTWLLLLSGANRSEFPPPNGNCWEFATWPVPSPRPPQEKTCTVVPAARLGSKLMHPWVCIKC